MRSHDDPTQSLSERLREIEHALAHEAADALDTKGAMTKDQEDAIYAAYLDICVLQTMTRKAGLTLAMQRSQELLIELGTAFPFIPERVARSASSRDSST